MGGSTVGCSGRPWAAVALAACGAALGWGAQAAPLEVYGKLPSIEQAALSPSGDQLAAIVTDGEQRRILVEDVAHDKVTFVGVLGTAKVRDVRWAGEQHVLISSSSTTRPFDVLGPTAEYLFATDLNLATKRANPMLGDVVDSMNNVLGVPVVRMVGGRPVAFVEGFHFQSNLGTVSLFQVDLETDRGRLVQDGKVNTEGYVVDPDGRLLAQELYDRRSGAWTLRMNTAAGWKDVMAREEPIDAPDVLGLGRDGRSVVVSSDWKEGSGWREVSADAVGAELTTTLGDQSPIHDPLSGRLIGRFSLEGDEARYSFFDPADQKVWDAAVAAYPRDRVQLVSWSQDRKRLLLRLDSPTEGPGYVIYTPALHAGSWVGAEYEGLKPADVSPVEPVRFKAADGLELSGYLTLPNGREPKALPLIVFPHGGPAARDEPGFDWWAQAMASRGYAVLQVNYRGSDGFGWDFLKAGFGEFGRKMQSDLSDGVRYLASRGTIDPKRVCIVGASYGGYAALAGATLEKGVYRCAVSYGGVTDLKRLVAYSSDRAGPAAMRYWDRFMGAKDMSDPVLARYSPALQAANATAPILLIHGKDDTVVPLAQSREMADALRRAGKPVELVTLNSTDHRLSQGDTRAAMLKATMAFVEKNNPPN